MINYHRYSASSHQLEETIIIIAVSGKTGAKKSIIAPVF